MSVYERLEREIVGARLLARKQVRKRCELLCARSDFAMLRTQLALIRLEHALWRKYRPDQPRVRAGNGRESGRWAGGRGGGKPDRIVVAQADFGTLLAELPYTGGGRYCVYRFDFGDIITLVQPLSAAPRMSTLQPSYMVDC